MRKIILFLFLISVMPIAFSQTLDSTRLEFFPLHLGDTWQYYNGNYSGAYGYTTTLKVTTLDTLLSNGEHYCKITYLKYSNAFVLHRVDSLYRVWEGNAGTLSDTCLGHIREHYFYRLYE